jgi:predicted porin
MLKTISCSALLAGTCSAVEIADLNHFKADLYGKVRISTSYVDQASAGSSLHVSDHKTRLGIKGSSFQSNPYSLFYKLEVGIDVVDQHKSSQDFLISRDTYLGLKTPYGNISLGRQNTPFKSSIVMVDLFNHTLADADAIMGRSSLGSDINLRYNNSIYLKSRWIKNFQFGFMHSADDNINSDTESSKNSSNYVLKYKNNGWDTALVHYREKSGFKWSSANGHAHATRVVVKRKWKQHAIGLCLDTASSDVSENSKDSYLISYQYRTSSHLDINAQWAVAQESKVKNDGASMLSLGVEKHLNPKSSLTMLITKLDSDNGGYALAKQGGSDVFTTQGKDDVKGISFGYNLKF